MTALGSGITGSLSPTNLKFLRLFNSAFNFCTSIRFFSSSSLYSVLQLILSLGPPIGTVILAYTLTSFSCPKLATEPVGLVKELLKGVS